MTWIGPTTRTIICIPILELEGWESTLDGRAFQNLFGGLDMIKVVLLRHGESVWNKENKFTGWTDVDLSEKGVTEAHRAAKLLMENGYTFDMAYTSLLTRAVRTLWIVLDDMKLMWVPEQKSWRLNERHYGALQGLNKAEMADRFGDQQVLIWFDYRAGDPFFPS